MGICVEGGNLNILFGILLRDCPLKMEDKK